jgi:hypothetical protein
MPAPAPCGSAGDATQFAIGASPCFAEASSGPRLCSRRCRPDLGFSRRVRADAATHDSDLRRLDRALRGLKKNGSLQYKNGGMHEVTLPVSFKGFGDAYAAMLK